MNQIVVLDNPHVSIGATAEVQAKNAADMLHKHYPGYLWGVNVDSKGGVMKVFNLTLSGQWGFVIKLAQLDPEYRKVMRAGGEILERYRLSRSRRKENAVAELKRDFFRRPVFIKDKA